MIDQETKDYIDLRLIQQRHKGIDSPRIDYRDLVNTPTGGSGWTFVSRTTAATGSSITVTGLDLDTDLSYDITVNCRNTTNTGILTARINSDATAGKHQWASQTVRFAGGATETNTGEDTASAATKWELNGGAGSMAISSTIRLSYNNNTPLASYITAATGKVGDVSDTPCTTNGAGYWNSSDNITSILFSHNSGANCDWEVIVRKTAIS